MKKIFSLTFAVICIATFCSCGRKGITSQQEESATPAQKMLADFYEIMGSSETLSVNEIASKLISDGKTPFAAVTTPVEQGHLSGFTEEITGFSDGAVFSPAIGAIPFVGYIFRLDSESDTASFMQKLTGSADLRWNVCTQADEMICEHYGNTVFFVMSPKSFVN